MTLTDALTLVLTLVLVVITGFYAWVTLKILRANERVVDAMNKQEFANARPYVSVAAVLEYGMPEFHLRVANDGKTAALDLRLTLDSSIRFLKQDLRDLPAFSRPIAALAPGASILFKLGWEGDVFREQKQEQSGDSFVPPEFRVTADYEFRGQRLQEEHFVDLHPFNGALIHREPVPEALGEIVRELRDLKDYFTGAPWAPRRSAVRDGDLARDPPRPDG